MIRETLGWIWSARLYAGPRRRFYWLHIIAAAPRVARMMREQRETARALEAAWKELQ